MNLSNVGDLICGKLNQEGYLDSEIVNCRFVLIVFGRDNLRDFLFEK